MKIEIDNEVHEVIYIEYEDGIPFSVWTRFYVKEASYWRNVFWIFFEENQIFMAFEEGSGGNLYAIQWAEGGKNTGVFWLKSGIDVIGEFKNYKRLEKPLLLKNVWGKNRNPFKIAQITDGAEYCEECGKYFSERCYEHYEEEE